MTQIQVIRWSDTEWAVIFDDKLMGISKNDFDADHAANVISNLFDPPILVDHHPEVRRETLDDMQEKRRLKKRNP
jgi:hypothetical protein